MERLGETDVWADVLLWVLERDGWTIHRRPSLGGGHLVIAVRGNLRVNQTGATGSEAARRVFDIASRHRQQRVRHAGDGEGFAAGTAPPYVRRSQHELERTLP